MSAPQLRHAMVLETPVGAPDGAGGTLGGWQALGTLWAALESRTGRAAARGGVAVGRSRVRITVRGAPVDNPARPRPGQRLRLGARLFAILAVTEADAAGRYLLCEAEEEQVR